MLGRAIRDFAKSGLALDVTYSTASISTQGHIDSGLEKDSLNLVVSDSLPYNLPGASGISTDVYWSAVSLGEGHDRNFFPFFTNTIEHEFTHQLKGDTASPNTNPLKYMFNEFVVDFRVQSMWWRVRQGDLVPVQKTSHLPSLQYNPQSSLKKTSEVTMAPITNRIGIIRIALQASIAFDMFICIGLGFKVWEVGPMGFWYWIRGLHMNPAMTVKNGNVTFVFTPHYGFTVLIVTMVVCAFTITAMLLWLYRRAKVGNGHR